MRARTFVTGSLFVVGDGETLEEIKDTEAWIATSEATEVRR